MAYELNLSRPTIKPTGAIFALKNMGWTDRQELDVGSKEDSGFKLNINVVDPENEHK